MFISANAAYHSGEAVQSVNGPQIDDIILRAQNGSIDAFEQVYRLNAGRVFALCLRMTADHEKAVSLTQDVFVLLWKKLRSFRGESLFTSWLHRFTVNVVLMDKRSEKRRVRRVKSEEDPASLERATQTPSPGDRIDLEKAIADLPTQARQVFVLHDVEGYAHHEIADMLGVTTGTSKSQLHRARKLLQEALEL